MLLHVIQAVCFVTKQTIKGLASFADTKLSLTCRTAEDSRSFRDMTKPTRFWEGFKTSLSTLKAIRNLAAISASSCFSKMQSTIIAQASDNQGFDVV